MSSDRTVGQQEPPERPAAPTNDDAEAIDTERHDGLSAITTEPGDRRTRNIAMLVIEAELACLEGKQLDNPAKPISEQIGAEFAERLEKHEEDLVPAWTRPWEGRDE